MATRGREATIILRLVASPAILGVRRSGRFGRLETGRRADGARRPDHRVISTPGVTMLGKIGENPRRPE
jgi:hypothetical protein